MLENSPRFFRETKGAFDYYQLHRDVLDWVPCTREQLFPSTKQRKYHSYYFQDYLNEEVNTDKK